MKPSLAAALSLSFLLLAGCDRGNHPQQIKQIAPNFAVRDGQRSFDLSKQRGHVVVLNFWASWCAPCLDELPSLMALQKKMPGIEVVAISIDDDAEAYNNFLKQYGINVLALRDGSQGANLKFGTVKVPETFVVDRTGVIQRKFVSAQDWTSPEVLDYLSKL